MQVDVYNLLGVLQTLAYTAGRCDAMADALDSTSAKCTLRTLGGTLKNAADDVRIMFDALAEGASTAVTSAVRPANDSETDVKRA